MNTRSWGGGWAALVGVGRRSDLSVAAVVSIMLAVLAFVAVAAPRQLTKAERASLDRAISLADAADRRLAIRLIDQFPRGFNDDPLEQQRRRLDDVAVEIDASVLTRYGPPRLIADSSRFSVSGIGVTEPEVDQPIEPPPAPPLPTFVTFRTHPELDQHSRLVEGRRSQRTDRTINEQEVLEFELTQASASELGWKLGEVVQLTTDSTDLITRQFDGGLPDDFVGQLVGLRDLSPPGESYWFGDARLHRPTVADTGTGASVFAFAMITPDQLPTRPFLVEQSSPFLVEQRRDLVDGAVDLDSVGATLAGLTALDASFARQSALGRPGVTAGLAPILEVEQDQRRAARSTLVLAAVGVFGVALIALGQLLLASFGRRRGWLTVARARGASRWQLVSGGLAEMTVIAGSAVLVGAVAAIALIGGSGSSLEKLLLVSLFGGAVCAAGLMAVSEGLRSVAVSGRAAPHPGIGRWARIGGSLVVVIAVAAVVTFRRRGLAIDAPGVDPLVVLLPVLIPLAVVYLSRWMLPAILRRVASHGLALGPGRLVGLRRVITAPEATLGVHTVLVLALTVASLGVSIDRSLARGAVDASWVAVGAPYRLDTRETSALEAFRQIPDALVSASGSTRINIGRNEATFNVQFVTIDVAPLRQITNGTAADAGYPAELDEEAISGAVPVVASDRIGGQRVRVGDSFVGVGSRVGQEFVVVETRTSGFGRSSDWVLADRARYAGVSGVEPAFNEIFIDVSQEARSSAEQIAAAVGDELEARSDLLDVQRDDPLSRAVHRGYLIAGLMAVLLALLGLVAIAVVTARQRRAEVAILGILGSGPREIFRAVASELVPAVLWGVVTGSLVGWMVVWFYDGRYDLSSFAAGSPVSIRPDVVAVTVIAALLGLAAIAVIVVMVRRIVVGPVGEILRTDGAL